MVDAEKSTQAQGAAEEVTEGSLLEQIMSQTKMKPADEGYGVAKRGVEALIGELLRPTRREEKVNRNVVDDMLSELDKKLSMQVDEIMHQAAFQKIESAWRGLHMLVDRTDFRQNIRISLMNVSKDKLLEDFEEAMDVTKSGLYKHVYTAEYGQFGGKPYGAIIGNYDFGPGGQDIQLLRYVASVSAMSHAPFISAAGPQFFGLNDFEGLPNLKDLDAIFEGPQYAKWRGFRETEDARYIGLTLPRFLLREPYGKNSKPVKAFDYEENVSGTHENYLWGNTAFAFATRLTESFAKYRWCPNIIGPKGGGAVDNLPLHQFESMGQIETKIPTEVLVSDRREFELAEQGLIGLTMRKDSDNAAFFSAQSAQKAKTFGDKDAELNYKLGQQLPYVFVVSRLAHYLKVLQRENIGTWKERSDLERELNTWLRQYIANQDNPPAEVRSRRPFKEARVVVEDVAGEPGWYRVQLFVRPHFKYMGADFQLSLVGKLDKS